MKYLDLKTKNDFDRNRSQKTYLFLKKGLYSTILFLIISFIGVFFIERKHARMQGQFLDFIIAVEDYQESFHDLNTIMMDIKYNVLNRSSSSQEVTASFGFTSDDLEIEWIRLKATREKLRYYITSKVRNLTIWSTEEKAYSIYQEQLNIIRENISKDGKIDDISIGDIFKLQKAHFYLAREFKDLLYQIESENDASRVRHKIWNYSFQIMIGISITVLMLLIFGPSRKSIRGLMSHLKDINENVFRLLYSFHGALFLVDEDFNIQWMNNDAEALLDPDLMMSNELTIGNGIQWLSLEVGQTILDVLDGKIENGVELELIDSDGYRKTVMLYAREEKYLSDEVRLITLNDITIQKKAEVAMKKLALKDELTGLYNRHYLEMIIRNEIEYSEKYDKALSIILIDLDHFKQANDRWGHPVGDSVLKLIAHVIKNQVRSKDYVIRLGGEEFIILMPEVKLSKAKMKAENIRRAIEESVHPVAGITTASIGVAEKQKGESYRRLYKRVDRAMYEAKSWGRNYVVTSVEDDHKDLLQSLEWREEWNSGHSMLDKQHKELFRMANCASDIVPIAMENKDTVLEHIDGILSRIKDHFEHEERILEDIQYADINMHIDEHKILLKRALKLREAYENDLITQNNLFVYIFDEVIVNHMLREDIKFYDDMK